MEVGKRIYPKMRPFATACRNSVLYGKTKVHLVSKVNTEVWDKVEVSTRIIWK